MATLATIPDSSFEALLVKLAAGDDTRPDIDLRHLEREVPRVAEFVRAAIGMAGLRRFAGELVFAAEVYTMGHDMPAVADCPEAFVKCLADDCSETAGLSVDQYEHWTGQDKGAFFDALNAFCVYYLANRT